MWKRRRAGKPRRPVRGVRAAALVCVVVSLAGGCQRAGGGGATPAPATVVRPSATLPLEVAASTALVRSREHPEYGPVAETRVTLRNLGAVPLRLTLSSACTVMVRVFVTPERTEPHTWSLGGEVGGCKGIDLPRTVPARGVDTLRSRVPVWAILGDTLPRGRVYYFSAYVAIRELPQQHVELPAGALRLPP